LCRNLLIYIIDSPVLVAPIGASAVLLFAVPASPLAQPWSIIGGNTISALVGVLVASVIPDPMLAGAVAVALAIATMSVTRCLHPPGGAAALTAVLGGPAVTALGFEFALFPVAVNSLLLVAAGWTYHRFSGHSYPHVPAVKPVNTHATSDPSPQLRGAITTEDVNEAIDEFGEALDISPDDLGALFRQAELHAMERLHANVTCGDIMSRDVVSVAADALPHVAREKLIHHALRTLPVVDEHNVVVGLVSHEQLAKASTRVSDIMAPAVVERPNTPAFRLLGLLSSGQTHEAAIVDDQGKLLGVVTPTDLLVVSARNALSQAGQPA
jgi:CBS domain-containing membrane protein